MPQWLAMLLSMGIEAIVAAALIAALRWGSAGRAAAAAVLGTMLTHWAAWTSAPSAMAALGDVPGFFGVEAAVTLVEAVVYRFVVPTRAGRALVLSLVANGISSGIGVVLYAFNLL